MDTITHGITGALIAKALGFEGSERPGRPDHTVTFAVTAGSVFPDSDTFASFFYRDRIAFLEIHRGITHSLVMLPVFSLLFGCLTARWLGRREKWKFFSLLYALGLASHILLDVITSYGTMVWSPISMARVSWDMTFIIDLVFTSIVLVPQLVAWAYSVPARARLRGWGVWIALSVAGALIAVAVASLGVPISGWSFAAGSVVIAAALWMPSIGGRGFRWPVSAFCRAGVAVWLVYLGFCGVAHFAALQRVKSFAKDSGYTIERMAALPSPPSLLGWSGLVETDKGVYRASIDLTSSDPPSYIPFLNAEDNRYIQQAALLPKAKTYLWFARFPWVTYESKDGLNVVKFKDVSFFSPPRRNEPPFTFQVSIDHAGNVVSAVLLSR